MSDRETNGMANGDNAAIETDKRDPRPTNLESMTKETDAFQSEVDQIMATIVAPEATDDAEKQANEADGGLMQATEADSEHWEDTTVASLEHAEFGSASEVVGFEPAAAPIRHSVVGNAAASAQAVNGADGGDKKRRKVWPVVLLALMVLLIGGYLAGVITFMNRFMPHTMLNGEDVSLQTIKEVADGTSDVLKSFSIEVKGQGLELVIPAESINARFDGNAYARSAISQQHPWLWPLEVFTVHRLEADRQPTYDSMLLNSVVESAVATVNKDAVAPVDAAVKFDESTIRYAITPEVAGTTLDTAAVLGEVREVLNEHGRSVVLSDAVLDKPKVTADDEKLTTAVDKANSWLEATQELVVRNDVVATVAAEDLHKWVELDDNLELSFDSEACTAWARGELSEHLDSTGSKRSFATPDGRQITVEGGTYGWSINGGEIAEQIADNVQAGKSAKTEVTWLVEAKEWNPGGNEWGDTYIEIDLGAQHVRYFQGGKVTWESDCVSGGMNTGKMHATPTGVYYINSNMQSGNVELKGEIDPKTKEPEYISYVKYWMPFLNNSHALHDADWRSNFGGDIYLTDGSHGCVNLPPDKAAELYGMVSVGTVVVIHD